MSPVLYLLLTAAKFPTARTVTFLMMVWRHLSLRIKLPQQVVTHQARSGEDWSVIVDEILLQASSDSLSVGAACMYSVITCFLTSNRNLPQNVRPSSAREAWRLHAPHSRTSTCRLGAIAKGLHSCVSANNKCGQGVCVCVCVRGIMSSVPITGVRVSSASVKVTSVGVHTTS